MRADAEVEYGGAARALDPIIVTVALGLAGPGQVRGLTRRVAYMVAVWVNEPFQDH